MKIFFIILSMFYEGRANFNFWQLFKLSTGFWLFTLQTVNNSGNFQNFKNKFKW